LIVTTASPGDCACGTAAARRVAACALVVDVVAPVVAVDAPVVLVVDVLVDVVLVVVDSGVVVVVVEFCANATALLHPRAITTKHSRAAGRRMIDPQERSYDTDATHDSFEGARGRPALNVPR
jgi:hypothetical protein